ncbi:MAG: ATP-binding protein [Pseudomonadota bacterium]
MSPPTWLRHASLRFKYAPLVNLVILVPMVAFLVADTLVERRTILDNRVEVLQSLGDLLAEDLSEEPARSLPRAAALLERFGQEHPHLEILVLDGQAQVLAATQPERLGRTWAEPAIQAVLEGREGQSWSLSEHDGLPVLDVTLPVAAEGRGTARALHIAEPQRRLKAELTRSVVTDTGFVLLLLLLVTAAVHSVTGRLIIRRLEAMARTIGQTEWLTDQTTAGDGDELDTLARALSTMMARIEQSTRDLRAALDEKQALIERVEGFNETLASEVAAARAELEAAQAELLRRERLAVIGELTAGLAHEIRNPLQIIRGTAELVRRRCPEDRAALDDVIEEVARMELLVRELLDYARPLDVHAEEVILAGLVRAAADEVRRLGPACTVVDELPPDLTAHADPELLRRVLVNLLSNAAEALPPGGGRVWIRGRRAPDGATELEILDEGAGVAPEDLPHVFQPFFSRKEAGIGMGLPLSRRIVEQHGGTLELGPRPGGGAWVRLVLPAR